MGTGVPIAVAVTVASLSSGPAAEERRTPPFPLFAGNTASGVRGCPGDFSGRRGKAVPAEGSAGKSRFGRTPLRGAAPVPEPPAAPGNHAS